MLEPLLLVPPSSSKFGTANCVSETTVRNGLTAIIPTSVLDAMVSTARRGRNNRLLIDLLRLASALIAVLAITLILAPNPIETGIGMALLFGGGIAFILAHFRSKVRHEPQIETYHPAESGA